jgi:hypothetical protein
LAAAADGEVPLTTDPVHAGGCVAELIGTDAQKYTRFVKVTPSVDDSQAPLMIGPERPVATIVYLRAVDVRTKVPEPVAPA